MPTLSVAAVHRSVSEWSVTFAATTSRGVDGAVVSVAAGIVTAAGCDGADSALPSLTAVTV